MVKVTLKDGTVVEGTSEEIYALDLFVETDVVESEEVDVEPFEVGDYARVVDGGGNFTVGTIAKVIKTDGSSVPYKLETFSGVTNWATASRVVKATDEEVASAKAQAEADATERKLTAVFTDAGRKPNEYRKGDIVRVTNDVDSSLKNGDVGEITELKCGLFRVTVIGKRDGSNYQRDRDIEPIVFVENRLDRN